MILDMASRNEIDQALMHLLQQNIDAARDAEQVGPRQATQACCWQTRSYISDICLPQHAECCFRFGLKQGFCISINCVQQHVRWALTSGQRSACSCLPNVFTRTRIVVQLNTGYVLGPWSKRLCLLSCLLMQEAAVQFLEKVFNAASKYAIKPAPAAPQGPPPTQQAAPGSPIEIPNISKMPTSSNLEL